MHKMISRLIGATVPISNVLENIGMEFVPIPGKSEIPVESGRSQKSLIQIVPEHADRYMRIACAV